MGVLNVNQTLPLPEDGVIYALWDYLTRQAYIDVGVHVYQSEEGITNDQGRTDWSILYLSL